MNTHQEQTDTGTSLHCADSPAVTRIYVACLAAYNNGKLHGKWIGLDDDTTEESLQEAIAAMLRASPEPGAEEWAIHDYDGLPASLGENPDLTTLIATANAVRRYGEIFGLYMEHTGYDVQEAASHFEEAYQGAFPNPESFGQQLWEELGYDAQIPEHLRNYVDTDRFTNDLFLGGDYFDVRHDGETHVFNNCV